MSTDTRSSSLFSNPEPLDTIFIPRKENITPLPEGCLDVEIPVSGKATLLGCRLHYSDKSNPIILYFHGNGETVADYDRIAKAYTDTGLNIFISTYRGYGWSTGAPSVTHLYEDALTICTFLETFLKQNDFTGPLFIMGRSLGSASAIELVYSNPGSFKGLILDSAFAETLPLYKNLGFDLSESGISEDQCFNNLEKMRVIETPTLMYHAARDQYISISEAERLQSECAARTKQFLVIPGADHNSLIDSGGKLYFETIKKFTDTLTGKNTWRKRRKKFKKSNDQ